MKIKKDGERKSESDFVRVFQKERQTYCVFMLERMYKRVWERENV